jgi:endoglucanase
MSIEEAPSGADRALPLASASSLPRWRGFNLVEKFTIDRPDRNTAFRESDFDLLARWGFNFVRLPMDYRTWTDEDSVYRLREPVLAEIDQALAWGREYGLHVSINFHRAPGYCVNRPLEPTDLWTDEPTQEACAFQWAAFAERYRGVPNERLSFNLLNEPMNVDEATHNPVIERLVGAIREHDPRRLIIADGLDLGWTPVRGLAPLGIAQSMHAYDPWRVSHYRAPWFPDSATWPEPTWPLATGSGIRDRDVLRRERIALWQQLAQSGVGVHVGEFGTFNRTPHAVTLAWMEDFLRLFAEAGWGWCLWNLRGAYGPLDSDRQDVRYDTIDGHRLDRQMLELLRRY